MPTALPSSYNAADVLLQTPATSANTCSATSGFKLPDDKKVSEHLYMVALTSRS